MTTSHPRYPRARTVAGVATAYALLAVVSLPLFPYGWHLVLHVLGAVLFLGNLVVSAAWLVLADVSGDRHALRFAARTVSRADALFTAPGALLLFMNGLAMSMRRWSSITAFVSEAWVSASLVLLVLSGIVWIIVLVPQQHALERLANPDAAALPGSADAALKRTLRRWYAWGSVATLLPLVALMLMVLQPSLR